MTDARPELNVLALNSGSSSLKFGLYRVGSSRTQMLLSGEAEAIGEEKSKFHALDMHKDVLLSEMASIPSQREAIIRIGRLLNASGTPAPAVAAMIAALDGVDLIVFTGGIGENDGEARAAICDGLSWIGVSLDEARNRTSTNPISDPGSRCPVLVLASQEDEQIARHTWALFPRSHS
jgi:acetate kinase